MNQMTGLVSCIIPTFKRSDMLSRAIDSALHQTYSNLEVLVVDDNIPGSHESETVKEIVSRYSYDGRVFYVGQQKHINGAVARNKGISVSRGEFIAFLDDDDEWLPDKIQKQIDYLNSNKDIGGVTSLYDIYSNNKRIRRYPKYSDEDLQFMILSRQISMYTSTFVCRKTIILTFGGFNEQLLRNQDLQFFTDFLNFSRIYPLSEYLVNLYDDSDINRRGIQKSISSKIAFLNSVDGTIKKFDRKKQKRIYSGNYFEIVIEAFRAKRIGTAIKYLFIIGFSLNSYKDLNRRLKRKKEAIRLANDYSF